MSLIIVASIITLIFCVFVIKERRKQLILRSRRIGYTADDFSSYFDKENIPTEFSKNVYKYLQSLLGVKDVPIKPSDDLAGVLGIGQVGGVLLDEVIDDVLGPIKDLQWTRHQMDIYAKQHQWSGRVDDLVRLLFFLSQTKS